MSQFSELMTANALLSGENEALRARVAEMEAGLQRLATWGETHGITSPEMEAVARETLKQ